MEEWISKSALKGEKGKEKKRERMNERERKREGGNGNKIINRSLRCSKFFLLFFPTPECRRHF